MKFNLLKGGLLLSLIPFLSVAFADECTEINNTFGENTCIADNEGKAIKIDFSYALLKEIPEIIFNLKNLKELNLSYNDLVTLPDTIDNLKNLKVLDLSSNKLVTLPDTIGNLKNLEALNLEYNKIETLPESIVNLENLEVFTFSCTWLGKIPEIIFNLKNLKELNLEYNNLKTLPDSIGNLENLETLNLYYNHLVTLPDTIGNLKNLKVLNLKSNDIETLPDTIGNLENLETLNLYYNRLVTLPDNIGNLKKLETLNLYRNDLVTLPDTIGNLKNLKVLDLSSNKLVTLPDTIGNLKNLEALYLSGNINLETFPETFGNLKNLKGLYLANNKLEILPETFGNLKNLEELNLVNNYLKTLPENISGLKNLKGLYLEGNNNLTELPHGIIELEKLTYLDIRCKGLTEFPVFITGLKSLERIIHKTDTIYAAYYIYNATKNKCLRTAKLPETSLTYGPCDNSDNTIWIIPYSYHYGNYYSKANPGYCLIIENGIVSLKKCGDNNTYLYRNNNFIKSVLYDNDKYCIGSSENDPNEISLRECNVNDSDQIWYFNFYNSTAVIEETPVNSQPETVTVYLYNALKNVCITSDGSSVTTGSCDFSRDNSLWEIPTSHNGYYRSKANAEQCLSIVDGDLLLSECNENTTLYRDGNFIKSPLSDTYCIGSSEGNTNELSIMECNGNDANQIWYFNNWDPSIVVEETPVNSQPETVTIYFYNALKNVCITSDGSSVTTGSCDFSSDYSLWEIPTSHNGYYRSKANAEQCLSIVDGVVSLGECNENATLYRDGLFIRSPLSEDYCIAASQFDSTLEYIEGCDMNDPDHIWYFNIYTPEASTTTTEEEPRMTISTIETEA